MNDAIMKIVAEQYDAAVKKHPEFPSGQAAASIIAEELGELARELNDAWACIPGAQERAVIEAAHVAVTAIRTMGMLTGTEKAIVTNGNYIRQMKNEELTELIRVYVGCKNCPAKEYCHFCADINQCRKLIFHWLRREVRK